MSSFEPDFLVYAERPDLKPQPARVGEGLPEGQAERLYAAGLTFQEQDSLLAKEDRARGCPVCEGAGHLWDEAGLRQEACAHCQDEVPGTGLTCLELARAVASMSVLAEVIAEDQEQS